MSLQQPVQQPGLFKIIFICLCTCICACVYCVCLCGVCMPVWCVYTACGWVYLSNTEGKGGYGYPYRSLPHSLQTGSLNEPGARLVPETPRDSSLTALELHQP